MGKLFGFYDSAETSRRGTRVALFLLGAVILLSLSLDSAFACHNARNWSTGSDLAKLKSGEVVIKARLLEAYKDETRFPYVIMGIAYGMIYYFHVIEVVGSRDASDADLEGLADAKIHVRLNPSVCEAYYPQNFRKGDARTLVLKKGVTGLYDLVGGQE